MPLKPALIVKLRGNKVLKNRMIRDIIQNAVLEEEDVGIMFKKI